LPYLAQDIPACYIKEEATKRIEQRLKQLSSTAASLCKGTSGNNRAKLFKRFKRLAVHQDEVQDMHELELKLEEVKRSVKLCRFQSLTNIHL
jgi:cation transport regulator ChaC